MTSAALVNHLWQSSICALVIAALTLALRNNHARTRHSLWFIASIKFLIPFSFFVSIGSQIDWSPAPAVAPVLLPIAARQIAESFAPIPVVTVTQETHSIVPLLLVALWLTGLAFVLFFWSNRWRQISATARSADLLTEGREKQSLDRLRQIAGIRQIVELRAAEAKLEPGVFGLFRPVLLLPKGAADRLTGAQLDAILAHELTHIRRRDNLTATIHMFVEAVFWFHPLVWWIGSRLIVERERACDEEVLQLGSPPEVYAESILNICKFYLESPLPCVAGVTGANLKTRIEEIMTHRLLTNLTRGRKLMLGCIALFAVAVPILVGMMNAQSLPAPKFDVVSVKPCKEKPGLTRGAGSPASPGRLSTGCRLLADTDNTGLIQIAYNRYAGGFLSSFRVIPIEGGPAWIHSETFEIDAESGDHPKILMMEGPMMQAVLEDRFKLRFIARPGKGLFMNSLGAKILQS